MEDLTSDNIHPFQKGQVCEKFTALSSYFPHLYCHFSGTKFFLPENNPHALYFPFMHINHLAMWKVRSNPEFRVETA